MIEQLAVAALKDYERNARTHSDEQVDEICASIREFGFTNPVLIDGDNVLIAGHGRVLAAKKLKLGKVPAIRLLHLNDAQKRAYVLADNKLAMNAGWNWDLLRGELEAIAKDGIDIVATGFSKAEIDAMVAGGQQDWDSAFREDDEYVINAGKDRRELVTCPHCKKQFKAKIAKAKK